MGKLLKTLLAIVIAVIVIAAAVIGWGHYYRVTYKFDAPKEITRVDGGETIIAEGKALYDENGKIFEIRGVNFGNLFIAEGWMTVNSVGAKLNEDGSFAKVNEDGIVEEYEEIYQEEMDAILAERFTDSQLETLNDAYFYSYCTEQDFINIKSIGMNTIRLPMYYRNFMEGTDEALTMRDDAFEKLDYFLELAKKYDLKVIVDMHGVVGGQSGYEHSGTRDMDFWTNETYIQSMCELWKNIATYYVEDRPDLASTILSYDLVNEPTYRTKSGTGKLQWKVMDRLYNAIREVDTHHVISIEGVWYPTSLPNPKKYGWENVLYQYHFYNWNHDKGISNSTFYTLMNTLYMFSDYDVPKFVGEFNFFGDKDAWAYYLNRYDQLGWGWTIWSYKIVSVGWWDNSWGLVVNKMFLENEPGTPIEDYKLKLDIRTASYDDIMGAWSNEITKYNGQEGYYRLYEDGTLYLVLKDYFGDKCTIDTSEVVK